MPRSRNRLPADQRLLFWTAAALVFLKREGRWSQNPHGRPDDHEVTEAHMSLATLSEAAAPEPGLRPLVRLLISPDFHCALRQSFAMRDEVEATLAATPYPSPFRRATLTGTAAALLGYEPPAALAEDAPDADLRVARALARAALAAFAGGAPRDEDLASFDGEGVAHALAELRRRGRDVPALERVHSLLIDAALAPDAPLRDLPEIGRFLDALGAGRRCPDTGYELSLSGRLAIMLGRPSPVVVLSGPPGSDPLSP